MGLKSEQNKKVKKDALLQTAFDLFTKQGISNTSISNIVDNAGVAKGTFYLYFKDKYDIRDRLVRNQSSIVLGKAYEALMHTDLTSLEDKIVFMADHIIGQFSENKILLKFISKNLSWGLLRHEVNNLTPGLETDVNFLDLIEAAIAESDVKYKNPEVMIYMVVEYVGATAYGSILNSEPLPIEDLKPYINDAIRAIMHSQEADAKQ